MNPLPITRRPLRIGAWGGALLALLSGCSSTTALDRVVPRDTYVTPVATVAYGPEPRQQLDVYKPLPANVRGGGAAPLVVFFYGGSWTSGERAEYRFVGEALASRGIVAVVPDYRLSPGHRYPAFVQDSAAATAWALEHAAELGADPARVYVMGHSAGGYNAAMVALDARWLKATGHDPRQLAGWIGLAGPYEFLPIGDPDVQVAFDWPNTKPDTQPINHVGPQSPRTLLLAAKNDDKVNPPRNTIALGQKLQAAGVNTTVKLIDSLSHVTLVAALATPLNFLGPVAADVADFVNPPVRPVTRK